MQRTSHLFIKLTFLFFLSSVGHLNASPQPIQVALVAPFSGPYQGYGHQLLTGAEEAIQRFNAQDNAKFELSVVALDDECQPDKAKAQAELIVSNPYHAVIGHACSVATLAALETYAASNKLVITPTATNPKITQKGITTVFRLTGRDDMQAIKAANFLVKGLNSKRIAIFHDHEIYSKDLADYVSEHLVNLERPPVMYQAIAQDTRNLKPLLKKLKELEVDAIYFPGLYPEVGLLAKTLQVFQLQIPLISGDGIVINDFVDAAGGSRVVNSIMMTAALEKQTATETLDLPYTQHYKLQGYAAIEMLVQALQNTPATDGVTLANWLRYHEITTVLGPKSWDTNGDMMNSEFDMYIWNTQKHQAPNIKNMG